MRDLLPAVFSLVFPAGGSIPAQHGYLQLAAPGVKAQCIWDAHTGIADRQTDDRKQQHGAVFQSCVFKLERNECTEKVASLFLPCPNLASAVLPALPEKSGLQPQHVDIWGQTAPSLLPMPKQAATMLPHWERAVNPPRDGERDQNSHRKG